MKRYITYIFPVLVLLYLSSCTSVKQLRYFNDLPDTSRVELPPMPQEERYIQEGDRLMITIGAEDAEAAALFNQYGGVSQAGAANAAVRGESEVVGYLVAADGTLELPYIGKIKAVGLTAEQLKNNLTQSLSKYLKNPLVSVKFFQIKFTVLGEVRAPGTYTLPLQRTTFLDALGAAGDLPITAKRHDIQIYRDYNGKRTIFKVDLRSKDILYNQELFQIRHNDVIYVQPRDSRRFNEETRFYVSLITMAAGLFALFSRF